MVYIAVLVLIELLVFIRNINPHGFLIGWDNVIPEFNLGLNFQRALFSIWQEYRGLGTIDGMAHAANMVHTILISILSLAIPQNLLRFSTISLFHLLGGIAFYFLLTKFTKNKRISLLGSAFYMFNMGVIQMFFAPLEVFVFHFAALPIIALLTLNALEKPKARNLLFLFLGALFVSPQGFVPTVFAACLMLFGFLLLLDLIRTKQIKKVILIGFVFLAANAFWLLPYPYQAIKSGNVIKNARINEFSSEEIFLRNKSYGNIPDVLYLRGFMIDAIEIDPKTFKDVLFMSSWKKLETSLPYRIVFSGVLLVSLYGVFDSFKKRRWQTYPFLLSYLGAFFFLANDTFIISNINGALRSLFPLLGEALRFPFTKFIILLSFSLSIFFTLGLSAIYERVKLKNLVIGIVAAVLIFISYPTLLGNFTSPFLRNDFPSEYLDLFHAMAKVDPAQRIAVVPSYTFWNWQYRVWGQRGSGFEWYGIPEPLLLRAFDPWSNYNEQFYNEFSYALDTQNQKLLSNVIEKYDLSYLLMDQYMLNTISRKTINYDSLKKFLDRSGLVESKQTVGRLILYKTKNKSWVYSLNAQTTKKISENYNFEKEDSIYSLSPNYVVTKQGDDIFPVFPSLFSDKLQSDLEFSVNEQKNDFIFQKDTNLPQKSKNYVFQIPSIYQSESLIPVKVEIQGSSLVMTPVLPKIFLNNEEVPLSEDSITVPFSIIEPKTIEFVDINNKVDLAKNPYSYIIGSFKNSIKLTDSSGNSEVVYADTNGLTGSPIYVGLSGIPVTSVRVVFPKIRSSLSIENVVKSGNYKISENPDTLSRYSGAFVFAKNQKTQDGVELSARSANSELAFFNPDLFHVGSYILFADEKYGQGLPMNFYLDNTTEQRADVETLLSKTSEKNVVIINNTDNFYKGYGFHFYVKSVGSEIAKSTLSDVRVFPFQAEFLKSLKFADLDTFESPSVNSKISLSFKRINPSLYLSSTPEAGSYIVLSQAFDSAWRAYTINSKSSGIANFLPFIFGKEIKNHVLVNNWENGWQMPQSINNQSSVVIVYLPQYLEYLGYLITGLFLIVLLGKSIRSHRTDLT